MCNEIGQDRLEDIATEFGQTVSKPSCSPGIESRCSCFLLHVKLVCGLLSIDSLFKDVSLKVRSDVIELSA